MSSILRALKKLENEPRHLDGTQPLDRKYVPLADTGTQRSAPRIFMIMGGSGIICGLVILAGWWLFSEKFQPSPAVTQSPPQFSSKLDESPAPSQGAVAEKPETNSMKALIAPETAGQLREQEPASLAEQEPASFQEPSVQIIDQEDLSSEEEKTTGETLPAQIPPSLKTGEQVNRPAKKPDTASFSPPAPPAKTAEVEIPKLKDPDMKLQAITWSRVPQKRIAVINNRILREGETVSGYFINTINQDDVVLSQEGEKWKIYFR